MRVRALILGIAMLLASRPSAEAEHASDAITADAVIPLRDFAETSEGVIYLSDLLPHALSSDVRAAGSKIVLSRAPLPGSLRVFTGEQILKLVQAQAWPHRLAIPNQVTVKRSAKAVDHETVRTTVAHFLGEQGWNNKQIRDAVIYSDAAVAGERADLKLKLVAAVWEAAQQGFQLRLRCVDTALCKPFLVEVHSSDPPTNAAPARLIFASVITSRRVPLTPTSLVVKAGSRAMLVIEEAGMRITLPVICLQGGGIKDRIQARDVLHHRTMQAEVEGIGLVREIEQP